MTAVSQSYPNYLGGLNEQPDELKKPGQLVKALNVIPDPTIGLSRRPGFKLVPQSIIREDENNINPDHDGTWFEIELSNQINDDYIYFGNVKKNGDVVIFSQDGVKQSVRYTKDNQAVFPHKTYSYRNDVLKVYEQNGEVRQEIDLLKNTPNEYFIHRPENPLKYCVSKNHVIFTNPSQYPVIQNAKAVTDEAASKYYSFINLKLIDTANYNYIFKAYGPKQPGQPEENSYREVTRISLDKVDNVLRDYDEDLTLPLQQLSPFRFEIDPKNPGDNPEPAIVEVNFTGQIVQLKSDDGDGYRNEARYYWTTELIYGGKGNFRRGDVHKITKDKDELGGPTDLEFTFEIEDFDTVTEVANSAVLPTENAGDDITDLDATQILENLRKNFEANPNIDTAIIVGNGIYLESNKEFSVSTAETAVADVMNSQKMSDDPVPIVRVNTVAELPVECYPGFIVQVINSFDGQNDYYLEYTAQSKVVKDTLTKPDGYWKEIAKPYEPVRISNDSMPHIITAVRNERSTNFVFVVSAMRYEKRTAGTQDDNPSMFRDDARITALNYYKNRLFFLTSAGTVISSKAGEINDLFLNTAIRTSPIDPIDVVANSNQRVPIHGSAIINNGMALFGDSEQYMLTTNADLLTSDTVNVTKIANYTFDYRSNPIYLGANLGFISSGMTRFYEMTNLYDRGPVDINERSQQVQSGFGRGFNMAVSSREQSMVLTYKSTGDREMYIYRFRQENSQDSSQTSWVKWSVDRAISYASLPRDKVFLFLRDPEQGCKIYLMDSTSLDNIPATNATAPRFVDGYTNEEDGVPFKTVIKFPTIYAQSKGLNARSDVTANLTIHRVKLSTALIGTYDLKIERKGYDTYDLLIEQTPADEYRANSITLYGEKIETVPVYTRNKNLTLTMSTEYDAPLTLNSLTWEGDYNRPYYRSV